MPLKLVTSFALVLLLAIPGVAHHSFVMFDTTKRVTMNGTVTKFQWTNPHAYIEIDVAEGTATKHWSVELGSPSILMKGGWTSKMLKKGDKIEVTLNPLRNGDPGGLLTLLVLADGKRYGNGTLRENNKGTDKGAADNKGSK